MPILRGSDTSAVQGNFSFGKEEDLKEVILEVNRDQTCWFWRQGSREAKINDRMTAWTGEISVVTQCPPKHANPWSSPSSSNNRNKNGLQLRPPFCHSCGINVWDSISPWTEERQPAAPCFIWHILEGLTIQTTLHLPRTPSKQEQKSALPRAKTLQGNKRGPANHVTFSRKNILPVA